MTLSISVPCGRVPRGGRWSRRSRRRSVWELAISNILLTVVEYKKV